MLADAYRLGGRNHQSELGMFSRPQLRTMPQDDRFVGTTTIPIRRRDGRGPGVATLLTGKDTGLRCKRVWSDSSLPWKWSIHNAAYRSSTTTFSRRSQAWMRGG